MGRHMIRHLVDNDNDVKMYTRSMEKALELAKDVSAEPVNSVKEAVNDADFVISIVGYPRDVEEIYFGENGIIENAKDGAILIDMTTSKPSLAVRISEEAQKRGLKSIDAPVSGGDKGAKNASLSIMVGGEKEAFDMAYDVLRTMGTSISYMGKAGNGQHTKACNQICVAGATAAYTEALIYARNNGLDEKDMFSAISKGAAASWQIDNMAPRVLKDDLAPGFFIKHFIKDMRIIEEEMKSSGKELRMLDEVLKMYEELSEKGYEDYGTQAFLRIYDEQ